MFTLKKIAIALTLSTVAILPAAAAEGIVDDGTVYSRQQSERYMQNVRAPIYLNGAMMQDRNVYLQNRTARGSTIPWMTPSDRRETPPGFGG